MGERDLVPGDVLDKYRLERLLGRGGMGEVWAAHDPDLDRRIALKVLTRALAGDDDAQARLQREGRAMAKLRHPNVITVHDALFRAGRGLIAMELIDGESLAAWLIKRRSPEDVVRVMLAAGRGLAAAHRAGMVHRDFKPHNVLVDHDGRVVVTDFGLARASGDTIPPHRTSDVGRRASADRASDVGRRASASDDLPTESGAEANPDAPRPTPDRADARRPTPDVSNWAAVDAGAETILPEAVAPTAVSVPPGTPAAPPPRADPGDPRSGSDRGALGTPLTQTGALLGTPAYMAPEQLAGKAADARADQFAYCVTLWEAFTGARPFRGQSVEELTAAVGAGVPDGGDRIPGRLRPLIARGLAREPADRWPAMDPLLAALDRAWRRPRRIAIAATATAVVLALVAGVVVIATRKPATIEGCGGDDAAVATAWSPAIRGEVETALAGAPGRDRVVAFYDRWADSWKATRRDNCKQRRDPDFAARRSCLDAIRDDVAELVALRAIATPEAFANQDLYRFVPAPEACAHAPRELPPAAPPLAVRPTVRELRAAIVAARVALVRDDVDTTSVDTASLVERANGVDYPPVKTEALLVAGFRRAYLGGDQPCAGLAAAVDHADGLAYDRLLVESLLGLAECLRGFGLDDDPIVHRLDAITSRTGHPLERAEVERVLGGQAFDRGQLDAAVDHLVRSRQVYQRYDLTKWVAQAAASEAEIRLYRARDGDLALAADLLATMPADDAINSDVIAQLAFATAWRRDERVLPPLPASQVTPSLDGAVTIAFTVVDHGTPVAGAELGSGYQLTIDAHRVAMPEIEGAVTSPTPTGSDGRVRMAVLPKAPVYARAGDRAGFVIARATDGAQTIELEPSGALSGEVIGLERRSDPADDDLPGRFAQRYLPVALLHRSADDTHMLTWKVPVDASGHWSVAGLIPGDYLLSVQCSSFGGDRQARQASITVEPRIAVAQRLEFDRDPYVIEVVRKPDDMFDHVIGFESDGRLPMNWRDLFVALDKTTVVSRGVMAEPAAADKLVPGQRITRIATGRAPMVCTLPSIMPLPETALTIFFAGTEFTTPRCGAFVLRDRVTRWNLAE